MSDNLYISVKDFYFKIVRFCVGDTDIDTLVIHHKGKRVAFLFTEYYQGYEKGWQHEHPFFQLLEACEVDLCTLSVKNKKTNQFGSSEYHIWLKPVDKQTWKKLIRYARKIGVSVCLN